MIDGPTYRAKLIDLGLLVPRSIRLANRSGVLKMDHMGTRAAERYIRQGDNGQTMIHVGPDHWRLPPWHLAALERRERMDAELARAIQKHAAGLGAFA